MRYPIPRQTFAQLLLLLVCVSILLGVCGVWGASSSEERSVTVTIQDTISSIEAHTKVDGTFGPQTVSWGGVAWTVDAVWSLQTLGYHLPDALQRLDQALRTANNAYEEIQVLLVTRELGIAMEVPPRIIELSSPSKLSWIILNGSLPGLRGFSEFEQVWICVNAAMASNTSIDVDSLMAWLDQRRSVDYGGWSNFPNGQPHIRWTQMAVEIISVLGRQVSHPAELANWLSDCQNSDGGFGYGPGTNLSDLWYTYQALRTLNDLGEQLEDSLTARGYIASCRNSDGGFGDKPGWPSRISPTRWGIESLNLLGIHLESQEVPDAEKPDYDGLGIYSTLFSVGGYRESIYDSPADIVNVAHLTGLQIIGTKNPSSSYLKQARDYAQLQGWDVQILRGAEEQANHIQLPDFLWDGSTYEFDHISLWFGLNKSAQGWGPGSRLFPDFESFRREKLGTVARNGGFSFLEPYNDLQEYLQIILDQSIAEPVGYDFIDIGGIRSNPWLEKYAISGKILPLVQADQHKDCWWEAERLGEKRLLYIAENGTWEGFVDAAKNGRICVAFKTGILGPTAAVDYARSLISEWRWWEPQDRARNPPSVMAYPITPDMGGEWDQGFVGMILKIRNSTSILDVAVDGEPYTIQRRESQTWGMGPLVYVSIPGIGSGLPTIHRASIRYVWGSKENLLSLDFDDTGKIMAIETLDEATAAGVLVLLLSSLAGSGMIRVFLGAESAR